VNLDAIRAAVDADLADRLEDLHVEFRRTDGRSTEGFAAWLLDQELITEPTYRALQLQDSPVLSSLSALGTYYPETMAPMDGGQDAPGPVQQIGGYERLDFGGKLAEGAMGEIHVANDRDLQRQVAVKQMTLKTQRNALLAGRFFNEAQITAQLDHPNVVPVYSLESMGERGLAYTMKLIRGRTFGELIRECRQAFDDHGEPGEHLSLNTRLEYFLKVCDALSYSHSRGVVHRDLKPENVMVGAFGAVYVMDWGIARVMDGREEEIENIVELRDSDHTVQKTQLGVAIGTPAYMSPEQADGNNALLDGRSDQFSLGLILYELVSLRPAVRGKDTISILMRMQQADIDPLQHYQEGAVIPAELQAIIERSTQLRPEDRYVSVEALATDLRHFLRGEAVDALPDRGIRRLYRWVSANRELALLVVFFITIIGGSMAIGGLLLNLYTLHAADLREQRLTDVIARTSASAHYADTRLLQYQGLLNVLASNAIESLSREDKWIGPAGDSYFRGTFQPPDLGPSDHYGRPVSIGWPVIQVADDMESGEIDTAIRQLTLLRQPFRRLLLQSHSDDALDVSLDAERSLLTVEGTPVAWAYVALENGVFFSYPGHQGFPPGYDARKRHWYRSAKTGPRGPRYGSPSIDHGGMGQMMPCSMALYDDEGFFLGVAGIELSFDYLIGHLMEGDASFSETFVVNGDGQILVRSSEKGRSFRDTAFGKQRLRLKKFPVMEVRRRMKEKPSGHVVVDGQLYVWAPMNSIGWFYVAQLDADVLLSAAEDAG